MHIALLIIVPLVAALLSALLPREQKRLIEYGAVCAAVFEVAFSLAIVSDVLGGTSAALSAFRADALGAFAVLFISIVGLAAAMHSVGHLRVEIARGVIGFRRMRQYFALFHLFFFAMFAAALSSSPILMWVMVEGTTLATAFLVTFYGKPSALEAGWKFLIINSVGLLLGFLGTLMYLGAAASAGAPSAFLTWETLQSLAAGLDPTLIKIAFVFVLVGFGTKVGLVPMHTWLPDAHSNAPIPISSLLSGVLLNIALIGILRFRAITDTAIDPAFSATLLLLFGIVSLVVAALIMYVQKNYKRLLAYSSIEHMGIMTIGFALGGLASVAALFHMLYHALLKPILFFAAGNIFLSFGSTKIAEVRGAVGTTPISASIFLFALLAATGVPPSGIFFTKLGILSSAIGSHPYLSGAALLALFIVSAAFLKYGSAMLFGKSEKVVETGEHNYWTILSMVFLLSIFILVSIHVPAPLEALLGAAASTI